MRKTKGAKILIFDIETSPALVWTWSLFPNFIGIDMVKEDGYILCWAGKWLGEKKVFGDSIHLNPRDGDVYKVVGSLHAVLVNADIVVAHNGDKFDIKWANELFIRFGFRPLNHYKSIDTLKESRRVFKSLSQKLQWQCRKLELGAKVDTGGFELWERCMRRVKAACIKMFIYCKGDVHLLEDYYLASRAFYINHPNLNIYDDAHAHKCPRCGSVKLVKNGVKYLASYVYQRWLCRNCGRESRENSPLKKGLRPKLV